MRLDINTKPCSECGAPMEIINHGRPRITCSPKCRAARSRRIQDEKTRDEGRAEVLEALIRKEGTPEQWRAYIDLIRDIPGFKETNGLALRRAAGR